MSDLPSADRSVTAAQKARWDGVARAWAHWWPMIEAGAGAVSERLLDLAAVAPGERVLDLACGIGEPALQAARRVGPEGRVLGIDLAPTMIALARERAASAGLGNVELREMDAAAPDLPAGTFDVALSRWGLMFVPDFAATMKRVHALLAPSGRLALAVWAAPDKVPAISLATRVLTEQLDLPPPDPPQRTAFELADRGALEAKLAAAGFGGLRTAEVSVRYQFPSSDDFLAFRRELSPPDPRLADYPPARVSAAWDAVVEALAPYRDGTGRIVMENLSICIAGTRG